MSTGPWKKKRKDIRKLKPNLEGDSRTGAGDYTLKSLLKCDLDGRYAIARARNELEANLVDYAGGPEATTPPVLILIRKIVAKTLVTQQREKMTLLGEAELDKHYITMANSLRLDILALAKLLSEKHPGKVGDLKNYIDTVAKEKK